MWTNGKRRLTVNRVEVMVRWKEFLVSFDTSCVFWCCVPAWFLAMVVLSFLIMRYRRMHADGIDALIVEESFRWRVQLRFRQRGGRAAFSLVGLYAPTLADAQELADYSLRDHVCNGLCTPWELFDARC
jgi:hypothetical protein